MKFDCAKCGACCRVAGYIDELAHLDRGDGACRHLTDANLCAIYEERPRICRVAEGCPAAITPEEYFRRSDEACERLHLAVYGQPLVR